MLRSMIRSVARGLSALVLAMLLPATQPARGLGAQLAPPVSGAPSPRPDMLHQPGQNVTVSMLTMGNGDQIWELFGHTAILIRDNTSGRDTVFNWGVFDSHQPNFILPFLQGLNYSQMGGETLEQLLYQYRYFNRSVASQELDLSEQQRDSLLHLIQINARPEN